MTELLRAFAREPLALRAVLTGISYCDGSYHMVRQCSDVTVIEYVYKGEGTVMVDGIPVTVGKDTVYLLTGGTDHEYFSSAEDPWEKIFINLSGSLAGLLPRELGLPPQGVYDGDGLLDIFLKIADIARAQPQENDEAALIGLYAEALTRLSRRHHAAGHSKDALKMKTYLDSNTNRIVSNEQLAAHIYRSKDYCIKQFSLEYGVTPYEYHIQQKLDIARYLLRQTIMPISQVAAAVGYHDPQYFSGFFRKRIGVSPREYRKQKRDYSFFVSRGE